MIPSRFLLQAIEPSLALVEVMGGPPPCDAARRFLLATAFHETGPALAQCYEDAAPGRGWWRFEEHGAVARVLTDPASAPLAQRACKLFCILPTSEAVWRALDRHDLIAAIFARLLLLTDGEPLAVECDAAARCYARLWRPVGDPREWRLHYANARDWVALTYGRDGAADLFTRRFPTRDGGR